MAFLRDDRYTFFFGKYKNLYSNRETWYTRGLRFMPRVLNTLYNTYFVIGTYTGQRYYTYIYVHAGCRARSAVIVHLNGSPNYDLYVCFMRLRILTEKKK